MYLGASGVFAQPDQVPPAATCQKSPTGSPCVTYCDNSVSPTLPCGADHLVTENTTTPQSGWQTFTESYALANSTTTLVQGLKYADGSCEFSGDLALPLGNGVIDARQVGVNIASCQTRIETGTPPSNIVQQDEAKPYDISPPATPSVPDDTTGAATAPDPGTATASASGLGAPQAAVAPATASATRFHAFASLRTWLEDPIGIDVNVVRNDTSWYFNRKCVTGASGGYGYTWYSPSGWDLRENNWINTRRCYDSTSSSSVKFRNNTFCAPFTTYSRWDRNSIHGRYDGMAYYHWNVHWYGGCSDLLHFHHRLTTHG
jgi:hypothetical protein